MKIAVLSNVNLDMLLQNLRKQHDVFETEGYGQWITYCLEEKGELHYFSPEVIMVILDGKTLLEECVSVEEGKEKLREVKAYVKSLSHNYPGSIVAISTIDIKILQKIGNDNDVAVEWEYEWEQCIQELIAKVQNIYRFELKQLICNYGRNNFYSAKLWYTGSIPYSIKAIKYLTEQIDIYVNKFKKARKKVLLLDLDNTIWGGVLGEEGTQGIVLGNSGIGAIYRDTQKGILKLRQTGVLLAVVSKNNIEEVRDVFKENRQMVLHMDDFVSIHANWKPKSENITEIANELNLGLDSFVFLDDNIVEQEEIKRNLPEVEVIPFPTDISQLPEIIESVYEEYFWSWSITREDADKTKQYHSEILRKNAEEQAVSMDDFLRKLDARIELHDMQKDEVERTVQLINKTNQFNTCSLKMNTAEVMEYKISSNHQVIVADISDRYGENGLVAVLLLSYSGKLVHIDNFLMSCRVMGRKFENVIIANVLEKLEKNGINTVTADYIATSRNKPVEELWDRLGFEIIEKSSEGKSYRISTKDRKVENLHEVKWK